jgi:hypothetical protein
MAIDWSTDPALTDTHADVLTGLKNRDLASVKMDFTGDSNVPTGAMRYNTSNSRVERWGGASWADALADYSSHIAATDNPHEVTHTQVGSAAANWNANKLQGQAITIGSLANNNVLQYNGTAWVNRTLAAAGIASTSDLSGHTSLTNNPHSVTATQAGALAVASNLSDVANAATSWTNLGGGAIGKLATLALDSALLTGALPRAKGGVGSSDNATARANLAAAASGANADITSLSAAANVKNANHQYVGASSAHNLYFVTSNTSRWAVQDSDQAFTPVGGAYNLGTNGTPCASLYFNGQLINKGTPKTWGWFSYTAVNSFNGGVDYGNAEVNALSVNVGNAINSLVKYLVDLGLLTNA